ncbi:hypothetical protein [Alteribacillus bidgolensis]|uniref:Uncharacterized protein n=1 Tax=Alteribacillus bidgolensis TaxID=930129 RepID=A0A1G8L6C3_9BACI|nr:hypothetical protein [Alteribacillus bidgolensis]SDI50740.1 hypothetical protein SAMN05216352_108157 [Alteribacillus bidgolensis]
MVRLQGGIYYSVLHGHTIKLVYLKNNVCELHIDEKYLGLCSFQYIKRQINNIEKRTNKRKIIYQGTNLWEEAKSGTVVNITI